MGIPSAEIESIEQDADAMIDAAVEEAKSAPPPDLSMADKDLWADGGSAWRN
jgi:pyruvate dehydrogenase E1 component alpha subunit